jgi:K+-transporting ATPase ATPase C chain
MVSIMASIRLFIITMLICVAGYATLIWGVARAFEPHSAEGSLIKSPDGKIVGSELIAQKFTQPRYFWPRPSAVDFKADAAGGSNKSPTSSDLTDRAKSIIAQYGATATAPLPPELAAASGGGLDPHLTEHAALYQAPRVAKARGLSQAQVEAIIRDHAFAPGAFFTPDRLVNVLVLNLAVDALGASK